MHYNGQTIPMPEGWYRLRKDTVIKAGDKVLMGNTSKLNFMQTYRMGEIIHDGPYIRQKQSKQLPKTLQTTK